MPAVQRAGQRLRPGRAHDQRRTSTATSGSSTVRSSGARAPTTPTTACCWPAPTGTCRSTPASRWFALADASAGRRGAAAAPDERPCVASTRCSSPTPGSRRTTSSVDPATAGRWPVRRWPTSAGSASMRRARYEVGRGRALREAEAEAAAHFETYRWYPQRAGRVDLVVEHAAATGRRPTIRWPARPSPVCCRCSAPTSGRRSGRPTTGRSAGRRAPRARSASSG